MNQKELFLISLTIFFTIVAWIIADLAHIASTRQIKLPNESIAKRITVNVDRSLFTILKNKQ